MGCLSMLWSSCQLGPSWGSEYAVGLKQYSLYSPFESVLNFPRKLLSVWFAGSWKSYLPLEEACQMSKVTLGIGFWVWRSRMMPCIYVTMPSCLSWMMDSPKLRQGALGDLIEKIS